MTGVPIGTVMSTACPARRRLITVLVNNDIRMDTET